MEITTRRRMRRPKTPAKKVERIFRVLMSIAVLAACAWILFCAARKIVKPFRLYAEGVRENKRIEMQIARFKTDNARKRRQKIYLKSRSGKETGARGIGFVRKGEKSLFIQKPKGD